MKDEKPSPEELVNEIMSLRLKGAELEESETRYRLLLEAAGEAICVTQEGLLKYVNQAGTTLTGYSKDELLSKSFASLAHPEGIEELTRIYLMRIRGEQVPPGHRFRIISKEGQAKWVETWSSTIQWEGRPGVLSMIRDVTKYVQNEELLRQARNDLERRVQERTAELKEINDKLLREVQERRQAEVAFRENEERYRFLFDHAPIGIISYDTEGRIREINKKLLELLGSPSAEASEAINVFTFPLLMEAGFSEVFKSCISECEPKTVELPYTSKWGKASYMRLLVTPMQDVKGGVFGGQAIIEDVTERKKAEEQVRNSLSLLTSTLESTADGILVVDKGGKISVFNREFAKMWRVPGDVLDSQEDADALQFVLDQLKSPEDFLEKVQDLYSRPEAESFDIIEFKDGRIFERYSRPQYVEEAIVGRVWSFRDVTARKRAEDRVRESEERLRMAWETSPDALTISRLKDGTYVDVNRGYTFLTGYTRDEVVGRSAVDIPFCADPADRGRIVAALEQQGHVRNFETRLRRKDGEERTILISAGLMMWEDEPHLLVVTKDIEDFKRAEAALRESEQKYRLLAQNVSDVIWTADLDLNCTYLSPNVEKMNGWTIAEFMVLRPSDYLTPASLELALGVLGDRLSQQRTPELDPTRTDILELEQFRKDGSTFWTELSTRFLYDDNGQTVGIIGATRDISQRKRSEEHLKRLATAVESAGETIVVTDSEGSIIYVNPAFEEITGYSRQEALGKNPRILKSGKHEKAFYREMWDTLLAGQVWRGRFTNKRKDGTLYEETATISPIKDESGRTVNYVAVKRDFTGEAMLQKQLLHAQKMEAIGTLAGGMAHDFNNLLQAVLGYSDLLLMKKGPEDPDRKKLEVIQHAARDGADLVSRILTFSRKVESRTRPIDLNEEIRKAQKLLARTVPLMIEIKLVLAENLQIIDADPSQVEQVLLNLAVNAQHAMPDGGQLLIETSNVSISDEHLAAHLDAEPGKYVLLTVSDTGVGMEPEVLDRVFEPFFTTKANGEGTGLGLSMVHGIIAQHHGYIRCYSEPGRGTSFKIYFPVSATELISDLTSTREMPAFGTETVLLVDDDDRVLDMVRQMIGMGGYQVLTARNGEEALERYASHKQDIALVILDLNMPGMGGKRCLQELLRINHDAKILVASGYSSNGLAIDKEGGGARGFLNKPYDAKDILTAIRKVLDRGHL